MFRRIDRSQVLIKAVANLSNFIARNRGVPILLGIVLIIAGMIFELLNVSLGSNIIAVVHILLRNIGLVVALIGIMMLVPIGE